jgi:ABC-type microcin C transport system permease subunit YejB
MTEEIPVIMPRNNPMGKYFTYPELKGIPLSIESKIEYQSTKFDIIITAVKIIERPIPAFEFFIPEGYKIVPLSSTPDAGF